ncbi:uncharacterized protein BXZ73DRAFT_97462 [Epithele typhae]|uniref:uncharacterized protein n=1 Tax=Epithele typhae TaxID=378194 RepID=UPI002008A658|nr:uncharacterized protein BXZ73DRAFT_97462 [Epithele typhae]KAH9943420.1 hypothetical protein BXZ73DRAFT_97462 [Epithele typhae]
MSCPPPSSPSSTRIVPAPSPTTSDAEFPAALPVHWDVPPEPSREPVRTMFLSAAVLVCVLSPWLLMRSRLSTLQRQLEQLNSTTSSVAREMRAGFAQMPPGGGAARPPPSAMVAALTHSFQTATATAAAQAQNQNQGPDPAATPAPAPAGPSSTEAGTGKGEFVENDRWEPGGGIPERPSSRMLSFLLSNQSATTEVLREDVLAVQREAQFAGVRATKMGKALEALEGRTLALEERLQAGAAGAATPMDGRTKAGMVTMSAGDVRDLGRALGDVAAFIHEMEMREGLSQRSDGRGIERLRDLGKRFQSLASTADRKGS